MGAGDAVALGAPGAGVGRGGWGRAVIGLGRGAEDAGALLGAGAEAAGAADPFCAS